MYLYFCQATLIRHLLTSYPYATHYVLLSCACVPVKTADALQFVAGESITGAVSFAEYDNGLFPTWFTGPPFVQLARQHASSILRLYHTEYDYFDEWHERYYNNEHGHPNDTPEAHVIHTLLHRHLEVAIARPGETIIEEDYDFIQRPCGCPLPIECVKKRSGDELVALLEQSREDEVTIAFRGVDNERVKYRALKTMLVSMGILS